LANNFSSAIEEYTEKIRGVGRRAKRAPKEASAARKAVMEQIVGLGYHRGKLFTQWMNSPPHSGSSTSIPGNQCELKELSDRAFDPERMRAATKRLDRVFDVYSLERRRHSVTRLLDIGVPSLLILLVLVCAGTSLVRWLLGISLVAPSCDGLSAPWPVGLLCHFLDFICPLSLANLLQAA